MSELVQKNEHFLEQVFFALGHGSPEFWSNQRLRKNERIAKAGTPDLPEAGNTALYNLEKINAAYASCKKTDGTVPLFGFVRKGKSGVCEKVLRL